jgi:hypothetical protein
MASFGRPAAMDAYFGEDRFDGSRRRLAGSGKEIAQVVAGVSIGGYEGWPFDFSSGGLPLRTSLTVFGARVKCKQWQQREEVAEMAPSWWRMSEKSVVCDCDLNMQESTLERRRLSPQEGRLRPTAN